MHLTQLIIRQSETIPVWEKLLTMDNCNILMDIMQARVPMMLFILRLQQPHFVCRGLISRKSLVLLGNYANF